MKQKHYIKAEAEILLRESMHIICSSAPFDGEADDLLNGIPVAADFGGEQPEEFGADDEAM